MGERVGGWLGVWVAMANFRRQKEGPTGLEAGLGSTGHQGLGGLNRFRCLSRRVLEGSVGFVGAWGGLFRFQRGGFRRVKGIYGFGLWVKASGFRGGVLGWGWACGGLV